MARFKPEVPADTGGALARQLQTGQRAFSALKVGDQDVRPFLDRTDGGSLTDAAGLGDGLVSTPKIAPEAVTASDSPALTAGSIDCRSVSAVTVQTKSVTVADGEAVDLLGFCSLSGLAEGAGTTGEVVSAGYVALYRDATLLLEIPAQFLVRNVSISSPGVVPWSDEPGAGTYSYTLRARVAATTDVTTFVAQARYLSARVFKR